MEPPSTSASLTYPYPVNLQPRAHHAISRDFHSPQFSHHPPIAVPHLLDPTTSTDPHSTHTLLPQFQDTTLPPNQLRHALHTEVGSLPVTANQTVGPTQPYRVFRKIKRCAVACLTCRRKRARCDGRTPCANCADLELPCVYDQAKPAKTENLADVIKDQFLALSGQIEMFAVTTQTANNASERKRSNSVGVEFVDDERLASSALPSKATKQSHPEANGDGQRCLTKHHLSPRPKYWSDNQSVHYFFHSFIPGRSFTRNHSFSDLLRHQHMATWKMLMPALMTLYLEQIKISFVDTVRRRKLDEIICHTLMELWKPDPLVDPLGVLYFTLLANQYMIIRPRLRHFWSYSMVPSLRSDLSQTTLLHYGNLGLRLKINSHWIFSDIAHALCPEQPKSFLQLEERTIDIIDPLVGLSPQLLHIYACATREISEQRPSQESDLRQVLTGLTQRIPHNEDSSTRENEMLARCADAYLEGAHIYVLCRRHRRPASDPQVQYHRDRLRRLLNTEILPLSGDLFRAVWPLLPAFILCVTSHDEEERHTLREGIIQELHQSGGYSNIPPALDAISRIWFDEELDMRVEGCWESMVALIGKNRISLT